jgi:hypothetical protein
MPKQGLGLRCVTGGGGAAAQAGGPIVVAGSERFRDNLQDFTCVGARRPRAGLTGQRPLVPLSERAHLVGQFWR